MTIYDLGKEPVSAEQPAGTDITYGEDYQALTEEVKKLSSPTADSAVDWSKIAELSQKILEQESKNLLVASYLCIALGHTQGLRGCALGIHVIRVLLDTFWDQLYPPKKRKKGRINALVWWSETLNELLAELGPETWEPEQRAEAIDDLEAIDAFIGEQLPDGPLLRTLVDTLASRLQLPVDDGVEEPDTEQPPHGGGAADVREPAALPQPAVPQAPPVPQAAGDNGAPGDNGQEGDDGAAYFHAGFDFLCSSATKLFAEDSGSPISYQLNRLAAWSQVEVLPPATDGETMLPPPDEQLISLLQGQYQTARWSDLLSTAEGHVRQYLFWLDLSYWVATALQQLGATTAALAVENDTRLYLKRLPTIETFSFQGGLPFAGQATRAWLRQGAEAGPDAAGTASSTGGDDTLRACQAKALERVGRQGLSAAVRYFQENSDPITSQRVRFRHDLALCRLMLQGKKSEPALPFAERILEVIDRRELEAWEPELALEGLLLVHHCFQQEVGEEWRHRSRLLRDRLMLLAPEKLINSF
ncbi:type VI secretion system protein TssA [Desulfogranum mediterraneum]|uniref:type VI secretion system protein TssA n=1 Tax=Desulfogranum mediterraneum TaxID=160661 RepID=UPI000415FBBE|nr:type VI secretion system protein TssA [Desulfogranum mediterraneum]